MIVQIINLYKKKQKTKHFWSIIQVSAKELPNACIIVKLLPYLKAYRPASSVLLLPQTELTPGGAGPNLQQTLDRL